MARRKGALPTTTGLRDTSLLHGERGAIKMAGALPLGPFKLGKFEFALTHRASGLQAAAGTQALSERAVLGQGQVKMPSSQEFLEDQGERAGKWSSFPSTGRHQHSHLHLSNSERKQKKAGEEGKRDWHRAGQTFCLLITHGRPVFHLLDPRPLPLGVQEENADFDVTELRCRCGKDALGLRDKRQNVPSISRERQVKR